MQIGELSESLADRQIERQTVGIGNSEEPMSMLFFFFIAQVRILVCYIEIGVRLLSRVWLCLQCYTRGTLIRQG